MRKAPLGESRSTAGNRSQHDRGVTPKLRYPARRRQESAHDAADASGASNATTSQALVPSKADALAPNGNPQCWYHPDEVETDAHRLAQRTRQIDYGKKTPGYARYLELHPKCVLLGVFGLDPSRARAHCCLCVGTDASGTTRRRPTRA